MSDVTVILHRIGTGESTVEDLLPLVYEELRRLAARYMQQERHGHTLQPTALVHEAYAQLVKAPDQSFKNRSHFLGVAARAMRLVLVDHARARGTQKRGSDWARVTLEDGDGAMDPVDLDLMALDEAMSKLADGEPRLAQVVELRFFGGLTIRETSEFLGLSHTTVEDDWALARAWLARELSRGELR